MKKISPSGVLNLLLGLFVAGMLVYRVPLFITMFQRQGQTAIITEVPLIDNSKLVLPLPRKHLLVFWATWCGPCKIELNRINSLVSSGVIKSQDVIAISSGEDPELVRTHANKNNYQFTVGLDTTGNIAKLYNVAGTPTLILIDQNGKIDWMTMGLSPSLEVRLSSYFN